jgi:hypothetical protein
LIAPLDERHEQLELESCECDVCGIDGHAVGLAVDAQLPDDENLLSGRPAAAA